MRSLLLRTIVGSAILSLPATAQTVLFSDGFENGSANWSATGLWHLVDTADTCGAQVAPFPEGTHCAYYGVPGACNFDTGVTNSGALTLLTPIALPAVGPAVSLHCWTRHQAEGCNYNGWDNFDVEVSADGGASWTFIGRRCDQFLEAPDVWEPRGMDLSSYLGLSILVRFRFDSVDALWNQLRGVLVDAVEVRLEAGHSFCTSTCMCGGPFNNTLIGYGNVSGCTNSQSRQGELSGGGSPSVANDTVVLTASRLVTPSVVLFLQSTGAGTGVFSGDGRFCLTGSSIRLGVRPALGGAVSLPGQDELPISVLGAIPAAGATRYYQVVYRDPAAWCTSATLNYTDGFQIAWTP